MGFLSGSVPLSQYVSECPSSWKVIATPLPPDEVVFCQILTRRVLLPQALLAHVILLSPKDIKTPNALETQSSSASYHPPNLLRATPWAAMLCLSARQIQSA